MSVDPESRRNGAGADAKRILFLLQDRRLPSSRVRVLDLLPDLAQAGLRCVAEEYPRSWAGKIRMLARCVRSDVVFLQKKIPMPLETILLKLCSRRLVFDFDDAIYVRHESRGKSRSFTREIKTRAVLRSAHLVIAGNAHLQAYAEACNRNVRILPSCVDVRGLPVQRHERLAGPVVVGWIGSHVNLSQLALLEPVLQRLPRIRDLEVHVVCDRGLELSGVKVRHVPWTLETQAARIAEFDIGVMPLPDSEHSRGKCGYKAIQCMAAGVPVVVSDVGFNRELVADGVDGFRAATIPDFERRLLELIDSRELRRQMGARAREKIGRAYAVEQAAGALAGMLEAL